MLPKIIYNSNINLTDKIKCKIKCWEVISKLSSAAAAKDKLTLHTHSIL